MKGSPVLSVIGFLLLIAGSFGVYHLLLTTSENERLLWIAVVSYCISLGLMLVINTYWSPKQYAPYGKWIGTIGFLVLFGLLLFGTYNLFTLKGRFYDACTTSGGVLKKDGPSIRTVASCWHDSKRITALDWTLNGRF